MSNTLHDLPATIPLQECSLAGNVAVLEAHLHFIMSECLTTVANARVTHSLPNSHFKHTAYTGSQRAGRPPLCAGRGWDGVSRVKWVSHERLCPVLSRAIKSQPKPSVSQAPTHLGLEGGGAEVRVAPGYSQSPHPTGPSKQTPNYEAVS